MKYDLVVIGSGPSGQRAAIQAARAENMPKDNIERAIKKALGGDSENYEEIRYEGYGIAGAAVIASVARKGRSPISPP